MQRYFHKDKDGQMTIVTEPLLNEVSTQWQSKPTFACNSMVAMHSDRLDIKQRK